MNRLSGLSLLVSALALATVSTSSTFAHADDDPPAPPATIHVTSPSPDVTIGYVTGRAAAVASNGATAVGVAWKDVCIAPCQFKLPSGLRELVATGPGYVGGTERVELRPGPNRFVVKPGSSLVRWGGYLLTTLGLAALTTGVTFAAIGTTSIDSQGNMTKSTPGWAVPMAVAGGLAAAGGITMVVLSSTSIQREGEGSASATHPRFLGVGYAGKF
jgi:hypothetical protein